MKTRLKREKNPSWSALSRSVSRSYLPAFVAGLVLFLQLGARPCNVMGRSLDSAGTGSGNHPRSIIQNPAAKSVQGPVREWDEEFQVVEIPSPVDGQIQKAYYYAAPSDEPQPLVVSLHTWSSDYTQYDTLGELCRDAGYHYIHPDFRGRNNRYEACGSYLVVSDIDAAIDYAFARTNVDPERIYMIGSSGGGYATLLMFMRSKHPIRKFSAWVPLSDLARWHDEVSRAGLKYQSDILSCTGSENGLLDREEAVRRSPLYMDTPVEKLDNSELDIYAGVNDGTMQNGVIPITHSIDFYNKVLHDLGVNDTAYLVSDPLKLRILDRRNPVGNFGKIGEREVVLKKEYRNAGLTLFDGGHEILPVYAFSDLTESGLHGRIIPLEAGEKIWSGIVVEGDLMPYREGHSSGFYSNRGNQIQPLLLSNRGLYVWSEEPYRFEIKGHELRILDYPGRVESGRAGSDLRSAREYASRQFFPPSGRMPDELLFSAPQYNTWIELTYNQNQEDVLAYARAIIDNGFPPGVLMIDDTWQEDYGVWDFHPGRFPDPKAMMDELHGLGFKVMLWVCPFVSADQALVVREIMEGKGFLLQRSEPGDTWEESNTPAVIDWWNGQSALLDLTNSSAVEWFEGRLDWLVREYGVDGFKLDAGDTRFYESGILSKHPASPNEHCRLFAEIGLGYPLNEYRACWKMAGQPLAQRLRDKYHEWDDLRKLIPHMITGSLAGYTFSCPDMIGGGDYVSFLDLDNYDQELVVRSAQCHALMPMMQFSVAPWRILDEAHLDAVKKAVDLRMQFTPVIVELARRSAETGEPVMSSLDYYYPGGGYEEITDQFMVGETYLVAPMVTAGTRREVVLPPGRWVDDTGKRFRGSRVYTIEVPLDRIPYFKRVDNRMP